MIRRVEFRPSGEAERSHARVAESLVGSNGSPLPSEHDVSQLIEDLRGLLFPWLTSVQRPGGLRVPSDSDEHRRQIQVRLSRYVILAQLATAQSSNSEREFTRLAARAARALLADIPRLRQVLMDDAAATSAGDVSATSSEEVTLSHTGHYAITVHRLAHVLWNMNIPFLPRMMSEQAHRVTGTNIHPGARIGPHFSITRSPGVLIGETAIIGEWVRIFQGVTLGALSNAMQESKRYRDSVKRHPTIRDNVTVCAGATILGGNTVVGRGSIIERNAWLTDSVPPGSRVKAQIEVHQQATSPTSRVIEFRHVKTT